MISIGNSIIDRTSSVDVGSPALKYGGGGHREGGICQIKREEADHVVKELMQVISFG